MAPAQWAVLGSIFLALVLLGPGLAAEAPNSAKSVGAVRAALPVPGPHQPGATANRDPPQPSSSRAVQPILGTPVLSVSLCNGTVVRGLAASFAPTCGLSDPTAIAYDSFADRLFFANNNSGAGPSYVSILNATNFAYLGSIPTVGAADAIAYDPVNGNVYIGDTNGSVDVANASNGSIVARLPVTFPEGVAVDPAGHRLFVANRASEGLLVFNLTSDVEVANFSVQYGQSVAVDLTDHEVFVSNVTGYQETGVWVFGEGNGTLIASVPVFGWWTTQYWDAHSDRVFVCTSWNVVAVLQGSTGALLGNVTLPSGPTGAATNPSNGAVYFSEGETDQASVLPANSTVLSANISLGSYLYPLSIAFDPANGSLVTGNFYASQSGDEYWGSFTVIAATNSSNVQTFNAYGPLGVTYDPAGVTLELPDGYGCDLLTVSLTALQSPPPSQVIRRSPSSCDARTSVFDPAGNVVLVPGEGGYLAEFNASTSAPISDAFLTANLSSGIYVPTHRMVYLVGSHEIAVLNGSTTSLETTVSSSCGAFSAVGYDAHDDLLYVGCNGTLEGYNLTTLSLVNSVSMDNGIWGLAYDPGSGLLFVSQQGSHDVALVNATNGTEVGAIPLAGGPTGIVDDPGTGLVYVADDDSGTVDAILPATERVIAEIPAGSGPHGLTLGPLGYLNVADEASSALTVIALNETVHPVEFRETGLQAGTNWSFALNGSLGSTSGIVGALEASPGTYEFQIRPVAGFLPYPESGNVTVTGSGAEVQVDFVRAPTYDVFFTETGLPVGSRWSVNLSGTLESATVQEGPPSNVTFSEPNGNFSYRVAAVTGFTAKPTSGPLTVNGTAVLVEITFTAIPEATYVVNFTESGLSSETNWSVMLGGTTQPSSTASIVFSEPNGTYPFVVNIPPGLAASPGRGTILVNGTDVPQAILFSPELVPLSANFSYQIQYASCLTDGGVTNYVLLSAQAVGGASPYAYNWTLPTGDASTPLTDTTTTYGQNNTVTLLVSDSVGKTATHSGQLPMQLPPCPLPPFKTSAAGALSAQDWAIVALVAALAAVTGAAIWLGTRGKGGTLGKP